MTPAPGRIADGSDIADAKVERAHDLACALDETEAAIGQLQLGFAIVAARRRDAQDVAPVAGKALRIDFCQSGPAGG